MHASPQSLPPCCMARLAARKVIRSLYVRDCVAAPCACQQRLANVLLQQVLRV